MEKPGPQTFPTPVSPLVQPQAAQTFPQHSDLTVTLGKLGKALLPPVSFSHKGHVSLGEEECSSITGRTF